MMDFSAFALPLAFMLIGWLIALMVVIWVLYTLHRMRVGQDAMRGTLERIEQLLQRR